MRNGSKGSAGRDENLCPTVSVLAPSRYLWIELQQSRTRTLAAGSIPRGPNAATPGPAAPASASLARASRSRGRRGRLGAAALSTLRIGLPDAALEGGM